MSDRRGDGWNEGKTYEEFMGRWSRPLAEEFIRWLEPVAGGHWLDVGTGTGALAAAICDLAQPATVVACDASEPFVEAAHHTLPDSRVTFRTAAVGSLPPREGGYDAVVSGLALNFFPDPHAAVEEQLGAVRSGGLVGAYVWDYAEGMQFLRYFWDAATDVESRAAALDEGRRFPICTPEALKSILRSAGAERVRVAPLSVPTKFSSFDDYWRPFLGGAGPAPSFVSSLVEVSRQSLENELRQRLPIENGGEITLDARAWAVVGSRS
jgi:trans-aconitate methyltransferase